MSDAIQITIHIVEYVRDGKKSIELITVLGQMATIPSHWIVYVSNSSLSSMRDIVKG